MEKTLSVGEKMRNGSFTSKVFSVEGTDTSYHEEAIIYQQGNNWVFENKVKDQNQGKAVKFTSTVLTDSSVQFSNPAHDFPTHVSYTLVDAATVRAFIMGPAPSGGTDTIHFHYQKLIQ